MHEFGGMARATLSTSGAASGSDDASRCLLLALSHDELGVIVDGLADPLQPVVAVALSSTCLGLRTPLQAALVVLQQRHARAKALGRKGGKIIRQGPQLVRIPMTCADLRDAEDLDWSARDLTADDMAALRMILPSMPRMQDLYMVYNPFADAGMRALCEGLGRGDAPSLRMIRLDDNELGPAGAEALAAALSRGAMPNVKELTLRDNDIGDQGVAALAPALKKLRALRHLDLGYCQIGDQGVASLLDNLGKDDFKTLKGLYLDHNEITDKGCATVVSALKAGALPAIKALYHDESGDVSDFRSEFASEEACAAVDAALNQRSQHGANKHHSILV